MGWAGFDMDPQDPLTEANQLTWNQFLAVVRRDYKDDPKFVVVKGGLLFNTGWGPNLPFDVTKFISFANRVYSPAFGATGAATTTRERKSYVEEIFLLAGKIFQDRVKFWSSADRKGERWGFHSLDDYYNVQLKALDEQPALHVVNIHNAYFPPPELKKTAEVELAEIVDKCKL